MKLKTVPEYGAKCIRFAIQRDRADILEVLTEGVEVMKIKPSRIDTSNSVLGQKQFVWNQALDDILTLLQETLGEK